MYGGFILTRDGVRLIEYNARFGDPEAENIMPIFKSDLVEVCQHIIKGTLDQVKLEFESKATVCKYVVPEGYPDNPLKGEKIDISAVPANVKMYLGSVEKNEAGGLILGGSRAIAMVGVADTLAEAEKIAQSGVEAVKGKVFFRRDVGTAELLQKRVDHMKELRK
jgi:phosphoribosylamine--glycine ligase